eukprot:GFUD01019951.1.p1 GENE.GFUD01019951.1~~GFUD01019951.1.p1  ORF type:complete len:338 (+),score=135.26 GFUD01019951.1:89-1102(+)
MAEKAIAKTIPTTADTSTVEDDPSIECAVCLQPCVYPVQLPCKHIFCFLCVKGVTTQSKRCAMCRREIPPDYLLNPELLSKVDLTLEGGRGFEEGGEYWQWFYEGRNGWWVYDERTSQEVEMHYKNGDQRCELLIAGFLYIIDFEHLLQYRRNDPSRRRRVKRDVATGPKKGVAGLRIEQEVVEVVEAVDAAVDVTVDTADATQAIDDSGSSADANVDDGLVDAMDSLAMAAQSPEIQTVQNTRQGAAVSQGEATGQVRSGARQTRDNHSHSREESEESQARQTREDDRPTAVNTRDTARQGDTADQTQTSAEEEEEEQAGDERWQHLMSSPREGRQ